MLTIFCKHSNYIAYLEAESVWLKMQMVHERQRAERAIDTLLGLKVGVMPVTVPTPEERAAAESEVEKMLKDPEFSHVGEELP